jgi:hypothetical protein
LIVGRLFLIEKELREKFKKEGHSNFSYVAIAYLLDIFYNPSIISSITYILINRETKFFENLRVKSIKNIEIRHSDDIQENYIWFIHNNNDEISPKLSGKGK